MRSTFHYPLIGLIILGVAVFDAAPLQRTKCLDEYKNEVELIRAIQRSDECTMVAYGATWDGFYKAWSGSGLWDGLADEFCNDPAVEFGFYHYSGGRDVKPIPIESGLDYTLSSYEIHAYRGGRHYGEVALRSWNGGGAGVAAVEFDLKDVGKAKDVVLGTACYHDAQEKKSQSLFMLGLPLRSWLPAIIATICVCSFVLGYRHWHNYKTKMKQ